MNRITKIIVLIGLLILLFFLEQMMNEEVTMVDVQLTTRDMLPGELVLTSDVEWVQIPESTLGIKPVDGVGKYLEYKLPKNSLLNADMISDIKTPVLTGDDRIITIKCSIVESNGWYADDGDHVDIIMVGLEETIVIENAKVTRRFSEVQDAKDHYAYYSLIVSKSEALKYYENLNKCHVYISIKQER